MDAALRRKISATGATALEAPDGQDYAQFSTPLRPAQYAALDRIFAAHPEIWLRTYSYGEMDHVAFLAALPSLRGMSLEHGPVRDWSGFDALPKGLAGIALGGYLGRVPLRGVAALAKLKELELELPAPAADYALLGALKSLTRLTLRKADLTGGKATALFRGLQRLRRLELSSCQLDDLGFLAPLAALRSLSIEGRVHAGGLEGLRGLEALRELELLLKAPTVTSLAPLAALTGLERLQLGGLALGDVKPLGALTGLRTLGLGDFPRLSTLPSLAKHLALRSVWLRRLPKLTRLAPVAAAPALESLDVSDCAHLDVPHFRPFVGHPKLKRVHLDIGGASKRNQVLSLLGLSR